MCLCVHTINHNKNENKIDHIGTRKIDVGLFMDTNIVNIKSVSVWLSLDVLSNA